MTSNSIEASASAAARSRIRQYRAHSLTGALPVTIYKQEKNGAAHYHRFRDQNGAAEYDASVAKQFAISHRKGERERKIRRA